MSAYFVVHTQPNCEQRAIKWLRAASFNVYCPMVLVERFHARKRDLSPRPFLPRYLFVLDDGRGVAAIKRAHGVDDVVRAGLEPIRAAGAVIDNLRARELDGFVDVRMNQPAAAFRQGALLRGTDGYGALFQQMRGETRALVFLALLIQGDGKIEESRLAA